MTIDVPRLRKALEHVTAHPEEWDQDVWVARTDCGTTACLAGTVVLQAGLELWWPSVTRDDEAVTDYLADGRSVEGVAAELLGLDRVDPYARSRLFGPDQTLRDLWEDAEELTGGEIRVPGDLPDWADDLDRTSRRRRP